MANERGGEDNITVVVAARRRRGAHRAPRAGVADADLPGARRVQGRRGSGSTDDDKEAEARADVQPIARPLARDPLPSLAAPRRRELSLPMILLAVVTGIVGGLILVYLTRR